MRAMAGSLSTYSNLALSAYQAASRPPKSPVAMPTLNTPACSDPATSMARVTAFIIQVIGPNDTRPYAPSHSTNEETDIVFAVDLPAFRDRAGRRLRSMTTCKSLGTH